MNSEALIAHIKNVLNEQEIETDEQCTPVAIRLKSENLAKAMALFHVDNELYFDQLSCITGIDHGPDAGTMELVYQLYSIPYNHHLTVKVMVDRSQPEVDSLTAIWRSADWHEREAFDLLGIKFNDHPDMRRILLPADWEGHPLRKDYQHQEYYRGVKVAY